MRNKAAVLLGTLLLTLLAGCGTDVAPTAFSASQAQKRTAVIYGEDSIADILNDIDDTENATVALVNKELWEKFYRYNKFLLVDEMFPGLQEFSWHNDPTVSFCSGVLVTKDKVLTAGHCVPTVEACKNIVIVFGYRKGKDPRDMLAVPCEKVLSANIKPESKLDYAVLQLSEEVAIKPVEMVKKMGVTEGDSVYAVGHPLGSYKKSSIGKVRELSADFIVATLDVFEGNSGSPVFSSKTKSFLGILTAGESDFYVPDEETGDERVRFCEEDGCPGEFIIPIEKILADIGK